MNAWHKMELKVWVEGIQRVICGVTEATTCQDVVIALAHATGKTGRFTLVERWRDNERLLAPSEAPLRVLHKWGEYASDVQFILRRSDKDRRKNGDWSSKRTEKFLHNFTPHNQQRRSSASSIKKSLTFSGAHSFFPPVKSPPKQIVQDNSSLESLDERMSSASFSSKSSTSPYASLDKQRRRYHQGMPPHGASPYSSLEKQYHNKTGHTLRPSPHHSPRTSTSSGGSPPNTIERGRHKTSPLAQRVQPMPTTIKEKLDPNTISTNNNNTNIKSANIPEGYGIDHTGLHRIEHNGQKPPNVTKPETIISPETDFTKLNGTLPEAGLAEELKDNPSANKEDILKLVRLQQERLSVQDSQLKIVDSEMQYWETREQDFEKQYKAVKEETDRLQQTEKSLFESLQELDLVSWVDKLEIERQQEKMLLSEITLVRSQLANAESELLAAKNRIHKLNEETEEVRRVQGKKDQEAKENEIKVLHEISELQKQMNRKLLQHEQNQASLEELIGEVKKLESAILEKKTQIADYDKELRELNLNNFTKVPSTDWLTPPNAADLGASEKIFGRLSPSRPGSSRKMTHNPQLLKEAVATTRNPHGMWV